MVCDRCILAVKNELQKTGIEVPDVSLGEATIIQTDPASDLHFIDEKLRALGFSLIEDKRAKLVNQVKQLVEEVYSGDFDFPNHFRFSTLLEGRLNKDYGFISSIFSELENTTIEKYIVNFRIEKIKEYLVYSDLSLSDLSFRLGFSSVAHLSRQFKSHTGLNPSYFKAIKAERSVAERTTNPK